MNDEYNNEGAAFEILPLPAGMVGSDPPGRTPVLLKGRRIEADGEWEGERGRPPGRTMRPPGGRHGTGKRPAPRPPPRPRYPRGPYWGPVYGGGPYGLMVSDPGDYPAPQDPWQPPEGTAAAFEPVDMPAGAFDDGAEEEIPPKLTLVLAQKAPGVAFQDAGTLAAVRKAGMVTGPSLYILTFRKGGKPLAYVGVTGDLQGRIRKHMLCGAVLAVPLRNYRIFVAQPTRDVKKLRAIESAINAAMQLPANRGETTNQRSELEMEVMGPGWV